jgi:hypothetical protein
LNGFITLTPNNVAQPQEGDFAVEQIAAYVPNTQDPNGGSVVTLASGAGPMPVRETVQQIRALIAAEKGTT